jgi:hypothetical protein
MKKIAINLGFLIYSLLCFPSAAAPAAERPDVQTITPPNGTFAGGTVQIAGRNFVTEEGQSVYVLITDQNNFRLSEPADGDNERLYVQIPEKMSPGKITLVIMRRSRDGKVVESETLPYFITSPPSIARVSPAQGSQGTLVTINGRRFGDQQNSSYLLFVGEMRNDFRGSARAEIVSWNDTQIQAVVPSEMAAGPCDIRLVKMNPDSNKGLLTDLGDEDRYTVVSLP